MYKRLLVLYILIGEIANTYAAKDSCVQFFSGGFGRMFVQHSFQYVQHKYELITQNVYEGFYTEMHFKWQRFGFKAGMQLMYRDYSEKYPETADQYKIVESKTSSRIFSHVFSTSYKSVDHRHLKVFIFGGPVISTVTVDKHYVHNYPPPQLRDPKEVKYRFLTWAAGLNAELNLFKQYIWLSGQVQYTARANKSLVGSNLAASIGLNINISKLIYEDRLKKSREKLLDGK
jgi:hypothetical protein